MGTLWAAALQVHLARSGGDLPQEILKSNTSNGGILGLFRARLTMKYEHVFRYLTMQNLQYAFVGRTIGIRKMSRSESHLIWMSWISWDKCKCNHIMTAVRPIQSSSKLTMFILHGCWMAKFWVMMSRSISSKGTWIKPWILHGNTRGMHGGSMGITHFTQMLKFRHVFAPSMHGTHAFLSMGFYGSMHPYRNLVPMHQPWVIIW